MQISSPTLRTWLVSYSHVVPLACMAPPPLKKAKTSAAHVTAPILGPIMDRDSFVKSDSEDDAGSDGENLRDEEERAGSLTSGSDSDEDMTQSAPPSPPPTISKRKRGRKSKRVEEVEVVGS